MSLFFFPATSHPGAIWTHAAAAPVRFLTFWKRPSAHFRLTSRVKTCAWQIALLPWEESTMLSVEAGQEYGMRQCWCCQIAGIWIEFHHSGAGPYADGARQTSNTTLIRTRGAVHVHSLHACVLHKRPIFLTCMSVRGVLPNCGVFRAGEASFTGKPVMIYQ